jgi:RimJ/RimL family protein N-acetyltransferase
MVISSILSSNTNGRLWVDSPAGSCTFAMLWDQGNNVFYLSGDSEIPGLRRMLGAIVEKKIHRAAREKGLMHFSVRALSEDLAQEARAAFGPWLKTIQKKLFFAYPHPKAKIAADKCDSFVSCVPIDQSLLYKEKPENWEAVLREIIWMWPSIDRYFQHGFGRAAVLNGRIVCWCTSEYLSRDSCGIGIETVPEMRNKGVATATACKFVSDCLERAVIPHWETDCENSPSIRVAEKVGFDLIERAKVFVGELE